MAKFRWLHFCDLHWGTAGQDTYWGRLRDDLVRDLSVLKDLMGGTWDVVLFTGDLVDRGDRPELYDTLGSGLAKSWFPGTARK